MEKAVKDAKSINPALNIFEVSCKKGEGLDKWVSWLSSQIESFKE